jgi:hypothetical protein
MEHGYFEGLSIDEAVSLINQMVKCYTNPDALFTIGMVKLRVEKLATIVETIFRGLGKNTTMETRGHPHIRIVS